MPLKKSSADLVREANSRITTLSQDEALSILGQDGVQFVDIRDIRELEREGFIPGAFHAPRGMLEFWVDPDSPYYKSVFGEGKQLVLYCQSGWRSALATATIQDMGVENVGHIEGGFKSWKASGSPVKEKA
ncbi:MAG: rhodanese-like domain-containing protein [Pseudomonadota bacterium]